MIDVTEHIGLVNKIANRYKKNTFFECEDLIGYGMIGNREMIQSGKGVMLLFVDGFTNRENEFVGNNMLSIEDGINEVIDGVYVEDLLSKIDYEDRQILVALYYEDLKRGDIGKILGESRSLVNSRIKRAQNNLKKIICKELVS
ncbi:sigma-70 family RNA polymerase sigma factor [Clostridium sp. HBUAS56017]|uniref:RNA polymerase sigma factor n=1 Tax=Clostridium sp. HBUAS56017 TaxID=2571128 RepID=UPI00163DD346|nr:sigma-70 family RNA polymerase sigma factor [Clostridium sp. HBUAS56017]